MGGWGAADEEEEEEEPEEPVSLPGPDGAGVSDRVEFRPANTCRANSALVGGKGWGSGPSAALGVNEW